MFSEESFNRTTNRNRRKDDWFRTSSLAQKIKEQTKKEEKLEKRGR